MTTTMLALTFSPPPWTPEGAGDFQQLQALFKAAVETRHLPSVPRVLGEPVIVISREIWRRVTTTAVAPSSPQTILEYMIANYPGIAAQVEGANYPHLEVEILDMGRTARFQDAAIEAWTRRVDERDAEIGRLKIDLAHYREAAEGMTAQRVRELEEKLMMETNGHAYELGEASEALRVEEGKVARLTEELARRLAQVAEARGAEFDSSDDQEHEQGPLASEAAAVDATWDEHAIDTAEEMPSHAGDEP